MHGCDRITLKYLPILNEVLNGGLRIGFITEFAGSPWSLVKKLLHHILVDIVSSGYKVSIIYHQYSDGLDTYLLNELLYLYNVSVAYFRKGIRIRRSFKPEDYIQSLSRSRSKILFLVDPFMEEYNLQIYSQLFRVLRRLVERESTIIIFNRLDSKGLPYGGNLHRHLIHYLITFRRVDDLVDVNLLKSIDSRPTSFYTTVYSFLGFSGDRGIQYKLLDWVV